MISGTSYLEMQLQGDHQLYRDADQREYFSAARGQGVHKMRAQGVPCQHIAGANANRLKT
jgi:hypothetical protein